MSEEALSGQGGVSRRDFIKVTTGIIGGLIGAAIGLPAIAYVLDPALKGGAKEAWVPIGKLADMQIGQPYPFSFTRVQVNGWERTSTTRGDSPSASRKTRRTSSFLIAAAHTWAAPSTGSPRRRPSCARVTTQSSASRGPCWAGRPRARWTATRISVWTTPAFSRSFTRKPDDVEKDLRLARRTSGSERPV